MSAADFPRRKISAQRSCSRPVADELVDCPARLERGVQLDDRIGPEQALIELAIDVLRDPLVADDDEAARVVGVVVDEALTEIEDVQETPRPSSLTS